MPQGTTDILKCLSTMVLRINQRFSIYERVFNFFLGVFASLREFFFYQGLATASFTSIIKRTRKRLKILLSSMSGNSTR